MSNGNEERLQKALARAGIASRRSCEDLIAAGRVKVNGKIVTQLGTKIDPARDRVTVDDEPVGVRTSATPQKIYLMLNKPQGYLSTVNDPQGRPTIMDLIEDQRGTRLYPVGRLDADSEGLLLLTNDGAFANALSHPRFGVEKEYLAVMDGIIAMKDIEVLRAGVPIRVEDPETGEYSLHKTKVAKIDLVRHEGSNSVVRFILKEGKKRQVRLMAEAVEHPVLELKRVRFGNVKLADLPTGKYRSLSKAEVHALVESARQRATNEQPPEREYRPAAPVAPKRVENPFGVPTTPSRPTTPRPARSTRPFRPGPGRIRPFEAPGEDRPRRFSRPASPGIDPTPTRSKPAPTRSGPTSDRPARSGPSNDRPVRSGPSNDRPVRSGPSNDRPTRSGPSSDRPTRSGPSSDRPVRSGPPNGRPTRSGPTDSRPTRSGPSNGRPTRSGPSNRGRQD